ncbi:type II toxin-antitoxin system RelE/ParE family toxin [Caballeronia sp. NK8]|jgi:mRNA-degrading endonuclease RelE of RelBE toxin-antitoxin system|uniref:type II toxin-antitoxin system RelE/ParE family toxin n=1 Tax=Caballeronia sp. NK8 TaxID=140098 RepID=UPI001BB7F069|nr:type II toxin-antitoxin system RelE/ParE family toxin [Caballeronia sp. NK8]BCQ22430.1 type II toxin-antitoxin system RelE/ParE family toxin [Caballeronia sp. NK8]
MKVVATPTFERAAKKLHARDRKVLDEAVREILAAPDVGVAKKGDLAGVFVHKFKLNKQETLLSYEFSASTIVLLSIGSHENFYRDLKR